MNDVNSFEAFRIAAKRAAENPTYLGHVLRIYREHEGMSEDQLADVLDIEIGFLPRLYLCKRPDSAAPDFGERLNTIADYALTEAATLAGIIRQVDAIESLSSGLGSSGLLAAARDKEEHLDHERPPEAEKE